MAEEEAGQPGEPPMAAASDIPNIPTEDQPRPAPTAAAEIAPALARQKKAKAKLPPKAPKDLASRQTEAAEFSAIATFFFSAALVLVGVLQWRANDRYTKLSYALANPRFEVTSSKATDADGDGGKLKLNVRPVSGVYAVTDLTLVQNVNATSGAQAKRSSCKIAIENFYMATDSLLSYRSTSVADKFTDIAAMNKATPGDLVLIARPADLVVNVNFNDLFQEQKSQKFSWVGGFTYPINTDTKSEYTSARLDEDKDGRPNIHWSNTKEVSPECAALGLEFNKYGPPRHIRYQDHRTVRNYKDKDGNPITEVTTWKTPVVEK